MGQENVMGKPLKEQNNTTLARFEDNGGINTV